MTIPATTPADGITLAEIHELIYQHTGISERQFPDEFAESLSLVRAVLDLATPSPGKADERDAWQPIETAPKDREIWAFNGEQARMKWSEGSEWALWIWCDELLSDADPSPDQPTHWQPLPAPPKQEDSQQ